jgi:hypothetical protein
MIWPIKIFRGKQPYDPVNKTLVITPSQATTTPPSGKT